MNPRKPTELHIVDGTYNVTRHRERQNEPKPEGGLTKPKFVKGVAARIWDEYSKIGYWLTSADSHTLGVWCGLTAEVEKSLRDMPAGRLAQWRSLAGELGFMPGARSRINTSGKKSEDKKDQFFA